MHVKIAMVFDILGEALKRISLFPTMNNFPLKYYCGKCQEWRHCSYMYLHTSPFNLFLTIFALFLMLGFSVTV